MSTRTIVPNHFCGVTTDPSRLKVTPANRAGPMKAIEIGVGWTTTSVIADRRSVSAPTDPGCAAPRVIGGRAAVSEAAPPVATTRARTRWMARRGMPPRYGLGPRMNTVESRTEATTKRPLLRSALGSGARGSLPAVEVAAEAIGDPLEQLISGVDTVRVQDRVLALAHERPLIGVLREWLANLTRGARSSTPLGARPRGPPPPGGKG